MSLQAGLMKSPRLQERRLDAAKPAPGAKRILIVDDLPEMCDYLRTILGRIRSPHIHIETEFRPERALELVRENQYDLVLCDMRMPHVDGVDILRAAHERNPKGVRFLVTAYDEVPATKEELQAASLDAFIRKPLRAQQVLQVVLNFLQADADTLARWRSAAEGSLGFYYSEDESPPPSIGDPREG